jgi:hypothetical protein
VPRCSHPLPAASHDATVPQPPQIDLDGNPCPTFRCVSKAGSPPCWVPATQPDLPDDLYRSSAAYVDDLALLQTSAVVCPPPAHSHPLINPYNGFQYQVAPLRVSGTVVSTAGCQALSGAVIEVWQVDARGFYATEAGVQDTPLSQAFRSAGLLSGVETRKAEAMGLGYCRATLLSNGRGNYSFVTVPPGVFGPPQYINIKVSKTGFKTLTTRLVSPRVSPHSVAPYKNTQSLSMIWQYLGNDPWLEYLTTPWDSRVYSDPRVLQPKWNWNAVKQNGNFTATFNIALEPSETGALELDGYWQSSLGKGVVLFETNGVSFWATEVPHPRTWGTATGVFAGLSLRGVDFRQGRLEWGAVLQQDSFAGTGDALSIGWSNGDLWSKQSTARRRLPSLSLMETSPQRLIPSLTVPQGIATFS